MGLWGFRVYGLGAAQALFWGDFYVSEGVDVRRAEVLQTPQIL